MVKTTIKTALRLGYRHIDTAYNYQNEAEVGEALEEVLKDGKLKREDIFVTTKVRQELSHGQDYTIPLISIALLIYIGYIDHIPVIIFVQLRTPISPHPYRWVLL